MTDLRFCMQSSFVAAQKLEQPVRLHIITGADYMRSHNLYIIYTD